MDTQFNIPRTHDELQQIADYLGMEWYDVLNMHDDDYLKWHRIVITKEKADVINLAEWRQRWKS